MINRFILAIGALFGMLSYAEGTQLGSSSGQGSNDGLMSGPRLNVSVPVWMYLENDFFVGRDENYTNGFQMGFALPEESERFSYANRILGWLAGGENSADAWRSLMGTDSSSVVQQSAFTLTQLMFTPQSNMDTQEPLYGERSYVGWLGLGFAGMVKTEDRSVTFSLHLGFIGRNAIAHQTQDYIHGLKDDPKWAGWDNQYPNEFTVMLSLEKKYRLKFMEDNSGEWHSDSYAFWDISLGNIYTRAGGGFYLRWGINLPDYMPSLGWNPSEYQVNPFISNHNLEASPWSFYLYGGARGYAMGYDIFLDGPVFKDGKVTVDKFPVRAEGFLGFSVRYKDLDFSYGYSIRSLEYHGQYRPQIMGVVNLRYSF